MKTTSNLQNLAAELAARRGRKVLVYISGDSAPKPIDDSDAETIYQAFEGKRTQAGVDLILHLHGGSVAAAYKIAKLLRSLTPRLTVFVPYKARSSATLLCLAADHIVMSPLSELGPLDPAIQSNKEPNRDQIAKVSAEDVRCFGEMANKWFGMSRRADKNIVFASMNQRLFPPTLGALYRAERYMTDVANKAVALSKITRSRRSRHAIVRRLSTGYFEHNHCIDIDQSKAIGLPARIASSWEEQLMYRILLAARVAMKGMSTDNISRGRGECSGIIYCGGRTYFHFTSGCGWCCGP